MRKASTRISAFVVMTAALGLAAAGAAEAVLDMDSVRHRMAQITVKGKGKIPAGTVELADGKTGKACRFAFIEGARSGFATAWVPATAAWDKAAGISFWVKGDGSESWGGLELIDGKNYALRYAFCFPVDSTDWTRITVPWRDLLPELAGPPVDPKAGYAPSQFRNLWFGKWFYWRNYPAHAYAIDQIALEPTIEPDAAAAPPGEPGLRRFAGKLKSKKPVVIVTMGDSLSDKRHWANRKLLWSEMLVAKLRSAYGSEARLLNPAIGGTTLTQNLILMPRWLKHTPKPDLVTVWFGYNDWSSGVRGDRFAQYLRLAVERIRRMTRGHADVLLMTTCPAHARWKTMEPMASAVRTVAEAKKTGLADVASAFLRAASADAALKQGLWAWDKTHLGPAGHRLTADQVLTAIRAAESAEATKGGR